MEVAVSERKYQGSSLSLLTHDKPRYNGGNWLTDLIYNIGCILRGDSNIDLDETPYNPRQ